MPHLLSQINSSCYTRKVNYSIILIQSSELKICLSTILASSLNCDPPERQLLPSAPTCHFRVNMWAKEWQPWARARSAECQHSGCSLSARREANRQTAGSSRAWWGLLDRVQNSGEHLTAPPHNSCSLDSGSPHFALFKSSPCAI